MKVCCFAGGDETDITKSSSIESITPSGTGNSVSVQPRTASVRQRPTSTRISHHAIEDVFHKQQDLDSTNRNSNNKYGTMGSPGKGRVYASVAEMKRNRSKVRHPFVLKAWGSNICIISGQGKIFGHLWRSGAAAELSQHAGSRSGSCMSEFANVTEYEKPSKSGGFICFGGHEPESSATQPSASTASSSSRSQIRNSQAEVRESSKRYAARQ